MSSEVSSGAQQQQQSIRLTPVYHHHQRGYGKVFAAATQSSSAEFIFSLPVGRKELAETWWKGCPNACRAHLPSCRTPCQRYCLAVRRHVATLSKQMIVAASSTKKSSNDKRKNSNSNSNIKLQIHAACKHPKLVQLRETYHLSKPATYDVRIGDEASVLEDSKPWMRFRIEFVANPSQNTPKRAVAPSSLVTVTATKRKRRQSDSSSKGDGSDCDNHSSSSSSSRRRLLFEEKGPGRRDTNTSNIRQQRKKDRNEDSSSSSESDGKLVEQPTTSTAEMIRLCKRGLLPVPRGKFDYSSSSSDDNDVDSDQTTSGSTSKRNLFGQATPLSSTVPQGRKRARLYNSSSSSEQEDSDNNTNRELFGEDVMRASGSTNDKRTTTTPSKDGSARMHASGTAVITPGAATSRHHPSMIAQPLFTGRAETPRKIRKLPMNGAPILSTPTVADAGKCETATDYRKPTRKELQMGRRRELLFSDDPFKSAIPAKLDDFCKLHQPLDPPKQNADPGEGDGEDSDCGGAASSSSSSEKQRKSPEQHPPSLSFLSLPAVYESGGFSDNSSDEDDDVMYEATQAHHALLQNVRGAEKSSGDDFETIAAPQRRRAHNLTLDDWKALQEANECAAVESSVGSFLFRRAVINLVVAKNTTASTTSGLWLPPLLDSETVLL